MDGDDTLCYCFHISRQKIVNFVKRERPRRASMISDCFGAGTGCGWCIPYLVRLHEEIVGEDAVESEDMDPAEYERLRLAYLEEVKEGKREANNASGGAPDDDEDFLSV